MFYCRIKVNTLPMVAKFKIWDQEEKVRVENCDIVSQQRCL